MTYSIVARDPVTGELGGAVQTRWFAVGAGVLWVAPGIGAVATQSFTEIAHGPNGLAALGAGRSPADAMAALLAADAGRETRQVGIVAADGTAAAFTGARCVEAAGHLTAPDVSCQANMMERGTVWGAMASAFASAPGDLAARLLAALRAAEAEGGDVRGRQSAALIVAPGPGASPEGSRPPAWERRFDVRVDDSADPLAELDRLLRIARAYEAFEAATSRAEARSVDAAVDGFVTARNLAPDDDQIALWHAACLAAAGRLAEARTAFRDAVGVEPRAAEHLRRFVAAGHAD
ncbi:MAG TPA: DUF1028 domain-containing protein [Candidatus Limnocylindrales bacterium]|nr:DUF1028 domain-containing protein [Candidatus Limnocylindrales bacterium]